MYPLHDQQDTAVRLIIEAAGHFAGVGVEYGLPISVGLGFLCVVRVIDQDRITALAGQRAADRLGNPVPVAGVAVVAFLVLALRYFDQVTEQFDEIRVLDQVSSLRGVTQRQRIRVREAQELVVCADKLGRRYPVSLQLLSLMDPHPDWVADADQDRLHVARRHVDDAAAELAEGEVAQESADQLDRPVPPQRPARLQDVPRPLDESAEI